MKSFDDILDSGTLHWQQTASEKAAFGLSRSNVADLAATPNRIGRVIIRWDRGKNIHVTDTDSNKGL